MGLLSKPFGPPCAQNMREFGAPANTSAVTQRYYGLAAGSSSRLQSRLGSVSANMSGSTMGSHLIQPTASFPAAMRMATESSGAD